jgi:predicted metalloendopeptidase
MRTLFSLLLVSGSMAVAAAQDHLSGIDTAGFDSKVRFQDDLFRSVNGQWLDKTEIPPDRSNYGSFTILADRSDERIRQLIEEMAAGKHPQGSAAQMVGDFYQSFMDEATIEKRGLAPLEPQLQWIRGLKDKAELTEALGSLLQIGVGGPIGFFVDQDDKDATRYLSNLIQSGTTLPDRDYYLKDDAQYVAARQALRDYVHRLLTLAGHEDADQAAAAIVELETELARHQWPRTELRDAEKRYNKYAVADLDKVAPKFDFKRFLAGADVASISEINVATPSFFTGFDEIYDRVPLATWKLYLEFNLIDAAAKYLSAPFAEAHFGLHEKVLGGVPAQKPRWRRAVAAIGGEGAGSFGALGDVVGKMYVEKYFPPEHKERMDALVKNLLKSFELSIGELTWMSDETKQAAKVKLSKIRTKIGYTIKWRDYAGLQVDRGDLLGNMMRSAKVEYRRMIDKLGQPIDREEWGMTPQTVNAYYNPSKNEIVFPAAILQPPFFNPSADDAVNYGGIGAVIGHEISHAFDDQGSRYDGDGNLKNWWNESDAAEFQKLKDRLVAQYNEYEPLPGKRVKGDLTLGENIADLAGLAIAYKAYKISLNGAEPPSLDGFTGQQRFFVGWAQVWRRKYRDEEMIRRLVTDPHSPSYFRANGPITNIDAFYEAFDVKENDRLFKPVSERIRIW